ncbi:MAG TPA: MBL fold metallo-hydrolase [bacterium]|nr:MBL fold metallo-hydrolase [bacterium]
MRIQFLGSGDAFGSGGRLQTCILLHAEGTRILVDCGTTALIAMRRFGVDPNDIGTIVVTHLHGDHFGGIPFIILDGQLVSKRTASLLVAGPLSIRERLSEAMEVLFPGSSTVQRVFPVEVVSLQPGRAERIGSLTVTPHLVNHASGAPAFALRMESAGKVIAYSGDTEWTEGLAVAGQGADLFIAEAYTYDTPIRYHLDYATLVAQLPKFNPKRVVLTHASAEMLKHVTEIQHEMAQDGMVIEV